MPEIFSKEFFLLCKLASPKHEQIEMPSGVDFKEFTQLAKSHRLSAVVLRKLNQYNYLDREGLLRQVEIQAKNTQLKMLSLGREVVKLSKEFASSKIDLIFLKGPVQSLQIYGDISLKHSRDIDILIDSKDIGRCSEMLQNLGYKYLSSFKQFNKKQREYFINTNNQLVFIHPELKIQLELHWRLFANKRLLDIPFNELIREAETIEIGGVVVNGLGNEHLFNYLCAHGAKHSWSSLYWLAEIAHYTQKSEFDWEETYKRVKGKDLERPFFQLTALLKFLFEIDTPHNFKLQNNATVAKLVDNSLRTILRKEKIVGKSIFNYFSVLLYKMRLKKNIDYKLAYLHPISINDFKHISLSQNWFFLYLFIRPFLWSKRYFYK